MLLTAYSFHTCILSQGETLLGCSAGKLAEVKERDADIAAAVIKAAQWQVGAGHTAIVHMLHALAGQV